MYFRRSFRVPVLPAERRQILELHHVPNDHPHEPGEGSAVQHHQGDSFFDNIPIKFLPAGRHRRRQVIGHRVSMETVVGGENPRHPGHRLGAGRRHQHHTKFEKCFVFFNFYFKTKYLGNINLVIYYYKI